MMDAKISDQYGISPYGKYGMEIVRDGKQVAKFTTHKDQEKNWQEAVEWAKDQVFRSIGEFFDQGQP